MFPLLLWMMLGLSGGEVQHLVEEFEWVEAGKVPAGWVSAETNGTGTSAVWQVMEDPGAPQGKRILSVGTRNSGQTYNLLLSKAHFPANLSLSVQLRADSGDEDGGGGLVWQAQDARNYFITRWNPLEKNLRIYKVVEGKRTLLFGSAINVPDGGWHRLEVIVVGKNISVSMDSLLTLACESEPFEKGGHIGFWTKADASTSFDQLWMRKK